MKNKKIIRKGLTRIHSQVRARAHILDINGLSAQDAENGRQKSPALTVETEYAIHAQRIAGIVENDYALPVDRDINAQRLEDHTLGKEWLERY